MFRLLFLIDTHLSMAGGAEKHLEMLISNLDYSCFRVDVVQLGEGDLGNKDTIGGARIYHLPLGRLLSPSGIKRAFEIYRIMRAGAYDCVISIFESSDLISVAFARIAGVRALISNRRDTGFKNSPRLKAIYRRINSCFDVIIAVSDAVRESLMKQGVANTRIHVIWNAVDEMRFRDLDAARVRAERSIPGDATVLGLIANLKPVKDHATAIEAVAALHHRGKPVHLLLAGDGPLRSELETLVSNRGLNSFVHFLGMREDVVSVLAAMDIFVLSSLTEGMSNAMLEAMAAGKPIVASAVGGNLEVVQQGIQGFLVPPKDVTAFTDALDKLVDSKTLRERMGDAARQRVREKFSVSAMVNSYAKVIHDVIGVRP